MTPTSSRLLSLLSLLQSRRDWPGPLLAERLEVSQRTVRRDVDRLRDLGYPIAAVKGPDGGYRLEAGSELPPLLFDDDQAVAIAIGLGLATTSGAGIEDSAVRALGTVRQVMPTRLRRRIDSLEVTALRSPASGVQPEVASETLAAIGSAIHACELLRFDYETTPEREAGESTGRRSVQPHHLLTSGGRWYLVAWDPGRDDWRMFRVDRMELKSPTGVRFAPREVPGGDLHAFVSGRFRGSVDFSGNWPCRGEVILDRPAGEIRPFSGEGIVEELDSTRCRLILGAWSWPALAAAIGQFDADIEVVGPTALVDAFEMLAGRFARAAGVMGDSQ